MKVVVIILVRFYINVTIFVALLSACNLGEDEPRAIRGHTAIVENIAHGAPMLKPDRYCKDCHGVYQPGGEQVSLHVCVTVSTGTLQTLASPTRLQVIIIILRLSSQCGLRRS